jgi:hypothetical protein
MAIEVTQGIQDLGNRMPLVAGRRTFVRVHLDVGGSESLPMTHGALEARRAGTSLGWIWPENGPIEAVPDGGDRDDLDDALLFRLPASWLEGTVTLTAFAYAYDIEVPWSREPLHENNVETTTVTFHEAEPVELHLASLHLHRSFHGDDAPSEVGPADATAVSRAAAGLWRYHPVADVRIATMAEPLLPAGHEDGEEWDLGPCHTIVADGEGDGLWLLDWRPLMVEGTAAPPVDEGVVPDRPVVHVVGETFRTSQLFVRANGRAQLFGTWSGGATAVLGAPAYVEGCPNPANESVVPARDLALFRSLYDVEGAREFFVGLAQGGLPTTSAGFAAAPDAAWVALDEEGSGGPWFVRSAATLAHELAHHAGLDHAICQDEDDDGVADEIQGGAVDVTHPQQTRFPDCSLAEVRRSGFYGLDVYHDLFGLPEPAVISNDPAGSLLARAGPLLSFAEPSWIDPFHYCRLLVYYGVPCDPDSLNEDWNRPAAADAEDLYAPRPPAERPRDPGVPILVTRGTIDRTAGTAAILGGIAIIDPPLALLDHLGGQVQVPPSEIVAQLVVRGPENAVLYQAPISDRSSLHLRGPVFAWDLLVPIDPAATRLEVLFGDRVVAVREVSPNAPTARWTSLGPGPDGAAPAIDATTIARFQAVDPDGDPLTWALVYSPDGRDWQVVATGTDARTRLLGRAVDDLPGALKGRLRLLVSDGIHTTIADDEPVVRVADHPPGVRIDTPALNLNVPLQATVTLSGSAWDREDGALDGVALSWQSSRDGELGTGRELRTRELSAGEHQITLRATDSSGGVSTAVATVNVDFSIRQPLPGSVLDGAVGTMFERFATGADARPAPPSSRAPVVEPPVTQILSIAAVTLAVLVIAVWAAVVRFDRPRQAS